MEVKHSPIIHEINFNKSGLDELEKIKAHDKNQELIFDYPIVYIVNNKEEDKYDVYVGETSNIINRTKQHLETDPMLREDWKKLSSSNDSKMYMVANHYFNKSLTLDIENRLMHYLLSSTSVNRIYNQRFNQQNKYYTSELFDELFSKIWRALRRKNKELFQLERIIQDSALFKASPFHKLTQEQLDAMEKIKEKIVQSLKRDEQGQLVMVSGEAGSGKTVLMSSLFYEVNNLKFEYPDNQELQDLSVFLLVNHDEQLTVYTEIATKLGLHHDKNKEVVGKPTRFINNYNQEEPVDVIIIDEAHLLWTQGKHSYRGKNHLYDLLQRAKVVVAVFDLHQVLTTEQYWETDKIKKLSEEAKARDNYIFLENQMRINADGETLDWIQSLVKRRQVNNIPQNDSKGYEIKIFDDVALMDQEITELAADQSNGISRIIATFDWTYVKSRSDENDKPWMVREKDWEKPWNLQLKAENNSRSIRNRNKSLSWAEQEHTINEVGSTYTVQGFDLNYVGLIIGPSVKYRNGKIIFDREASKNRKATQRRTLDDGTREYLSDELLRNELNVLMTRGINGLYIYAVDEELRNVLIKAEKGEL